MAITADKVVTILEAKTEAYDAKISNSAKQFEAKMAKISAAAEKAGKATSLIGTNAVFDRFAPQAAAAATGLNSIAASGNMAQMQMRNLAFQFQDIGTMLAAGQSPFMLLAQQLPQVTMYGGSLNGVMGALRGTIASLFSPLGLATTAFVLLGSAAVSYFSDVLAQSDDSEEALKRQADLIHRVADRWGEAIPAIKEYSEELRRQAEMADLNEGAQKTLERQLSSMKSNLDQLVITASDLSFQMSEMNGAIAGNEIAASFGAIHLAIQEYTQAIKENRDASEEYSRVLDLISETMGQDFVKGSEDARASLEKLRGDFISTAEGAQSLVAQRDAFQSLRSALDTIDSAKARGQVEELVTEFEKGEISLDEFRDALSLIASFNLDLSSQINEIDRLGIAADQARNKLSKLDPNIDPARFGYADLPESGPRPTPRPNDFTVEDILDRQWRDAERGRGGGGRGASISDAEREKQAVIDLIAQLEFERSLIGMTAVEREKANALRRAGSAATDEQREKIGQLVEATYNENAALQAQQQAYRELEQIGMNAINSIADAFKDGKLDANEMINIVIQLIQQLMTMKSLGGGMGLFGGLFGGGGISSAAMSAVMGGAGGLYDKGGYTGAGGKYQPAGVVHKGEYVFSKDAVDRIGVGNLEAMHRNLKGYAEGGFVAPSAPPMRMASQAPGSVYAPQYNIDASGAEAGVETKISAALKEYDKGNYQRFLSNMGNARKRNAI